MHPRCILAARSGPDCGWFSGTRRYVEEPGAAHLTVIIASLKLVSNQQAEEAIRVRVQGNRRVPLIKGTMTRWFYYDEIRALRGWQSNCKVGMESRQSDDSNIPTALVSVYLLLCRQQMMVLLEPGAVSSAIMRNTIAWFFFAPSCRTVTM